MFSPHTVNHPRTIFNNLLTYLLAHVVTTVKIRSLSKIRERRDVDREGGRVEGK